MGTHTGPMTSGKDSDIKKYYSALEKIFYDNMPGTDALPLLPWERSLVDPPTYIDHTPTPKKKCNCLVDPPPFNRSHSYRRRKSAIAYLYRATGQRGQHGRWYGRQFLTFTDICAERICQRHHSAVEGMLADLSGAVVVLAPVAHPGGTESCELTIAPRITPRPYPHAHCHPSLPAH